MPEFLGMDKKKWLWVGLAAVGVVGLFLLANRGGAASAPDGPGLPPTGPPPMGNQTPPSFFDAGEEAAHFFSTRDRFLAQRQAQMADEIPATGLIRGAWEQLASGDWRGVKSDNRGMILGEAEARAIADDNRGPYAHAKTFWQKAASYIGNNIKDAARLYAASQGVPLPPPQPSYSTGRTPPIAPRSPSYGNTPAAVPSGELGETI